MRLRFVDRATYRRKTEPSVLGEILNAAADGLAVPRERVYVVPEGGSNSLAAQGCTALGRELRGAADVVGSPAAPAAPSRAWPPVSPPGSAPSASRC